MSNLTQISRQKAVALIRKECGTDKDDELSSAMSSAIYYNLTRRNTPVNFIDHKTKLLRKNNKFYLQEN